MDVWDNGFLDLVEEAHLAFKGAADGEIAFGALNDVRDGAACAEFSWEGHDESDPAYGHGWVVLGATGRLVGHFYIHDTGYSGFVCERKMTFSTACQKKMADSLDCGTALAIRGEPELDISSQRNLCSFCYKAWLFAQVAAA